MIAHMKTVVEMDARLTKKERLTLAEAYKNASHALRNSSRRMLSVDQNEADQLCQKTMSKEVQELAVQESPSGTKKDICWKIYNRFTRQTSYSQGRIESKVLYTYR